MYGQLLGSQINEMSNNIRNKPYNLYIFIFLKLILLLKTDEFYIVELSEKVVK